jgi:hypothetical protein
MEIFVFLAAVNDMSRFQCIAMINSPDKSLLAAKAILKFGADQREVFLKSMLAAWREAVRIEKSERAIAQTFSEFTIQRCECHSNDTRDKLLSIIEAGCGTLDEFDSTIRDLQLFDVSRRASLRACLTTNELQVEKHQRAAESKASPEEDPLCLRV